MLNVMVIAGAFMGQCSGGACYSPTVYAEPAVYLRQETALVVKPVVTRERVVVRTLTTREYMRSVTPVRTVVRAQPVRTVVRGVATAQPIRRVVVGSYRVVAPPYPLLHRVRCPQCGGY